jgi:hypothetical protein
VDKVHRKKNELTLDLYEIADHFNARTGPEKGMKNNSGKTIFNVDHTYQHKRDLGRQTCVTNVETVFLNLAKPHPQKHERSLPPG